MSLDDNVTAEHMNEMVNVWVGLLEENRFGPRAAEYGQEILDLIPRLDFDLAVLPLAYWRVRIEKPFMEKYRPLILNSALLDTKISDLLENAILNSGRPPQELIDESNGKYNEISFRTREIRENKLLNLYKVVMSATVPDRPLRVLSGRAVVDISKNEKDVRQAYEIALEKDPELHSYILEKNDIFSCDRISGITDFNKVMFEYNSAMEALSQGKERTESIFLITEPVLGSIRDAIFATARNVGDLSYSYNQAVQYKDTNLASNIKNHVEKEKSFIDNWLFKKTTR